MVHDRALNGVDLNLLLVLRALLAERHVTRASRVLGMSQSAASHALARLRVLFGDPLLVRSGRELALTPRAESLLPRLERGLGELSEAVRGESAFEPPTARRRFVVGMADYEQTVLLPALLARLEREAPGIDLEIVPSAFAAEQLEDGRVDLAMLPSAPAHLANQPHLSSQPLLRNASPACSGEGTRRCAGSSPWSVISSSSTSWWLLVATPGAWWTPSSGGSVTRGGSRCASRIF